MIVQSLALVAASCANVSTTDEMSAIRKHRGFGITTPCTDIKVLRAYLLDLDSYNRLLYYAGEITILLGHTEVTPEYRAHVNKLYFACAIDERPKARTFFANLPVPRETDSERRYRTKFWVRYFWLTAFAADMDDEKLLVADPPHSHEGSYKSWFWSPSSSGCRRRVLRFSRDQLMRVEKRVPAACASCEVSVS